MKSDLLVSIAVAADYLARRRVYAPEDVWLSGALKTVDYYRRTMWQYVKDLYNGEIDQREFENQMIDLIQAQYRRAWNEGMRDDGLDPATDMTAEWEAVLQDEMLNELNYIPGVASDVLQAAQDGTGYDAFGSRVDTWANGYNDTVNLARITCRPMDNYIWLLGPTENHCVSDGVHVGCADLEGVIATGAAWGKLRPQSRYTVCGGWRCECELQRTDEPVTDGGIPSP